MKIATWNVNSLRVRLPQVLEWISRENPDVFAVQETKVPDAIFPLEEIKASGYHVVFSGQNAYNGVALLSREPLSDVINNFKELEDPQRRVLAATWKDIRILNLYVPNGESVGSEKYDYKLNWLKHLLLHLKFELKKYKKIIILGDFNIAPHDIDVHDPAMWEGHVLVSEKERAAFQEILKLGFEDCFRALHPAEKNYSWWDYRMNSFKRNLGLRIDHILATPSLKCSECSIDKHPRTHERPSDHTVVAAEFV